MVLIYAYGKGLTIYCRLLFTCSMFMTIMSLSQSIKVIHTNQHIHKTYKHHILDGSVEDWRFVIIPLGKTVDNYIPKTAYTDWEDNKAHTGNELAERWFSWLQSHTDYDQLIMETSNGRDYWIHVSCRKNKSKNRHQVLRLTKK